MTHYLTDCLRRILPVLAMTGVLDAAQPSNAVIILADDLGWMDVGVYAAAATGTKPEHQFYETPHLNRLAEQGVRFSRAYATPLCSPTRASLVSGRFGPVFGFNNAFSLAATKTWKDVKEQMPDNALPFDVAQPARPDSRFPLAAATALAALPNARPEDKGAKVHAYPEFLPGHRCGFIGKWHIGGDNAEGHRPQDFGFDAIAYQDEGYSRYFSGRRGWHLPGPETPSPYLTDALTDLAADWLEQRARDKQPFVLKLAHFAVHDPFEAKPEDIAHFERKATRGWNGHANPVYAAMLRSLDDSVGRIVETLEKLGLRENTAVIFLSDNGGIQTKGGAVTSNAPLRGEKAQIYEGGIRVPFIASWPGRWPGGAVVDTPVSVCDVAPTLLSLAAATPPTRAAFDGRPLQPLLEGRPGDFPSRALFFHEPYYRPQAGRPELVLGPSSAIIEGDFKLIAWHDGRRELFNLRDDIGENRNLAESKPEPAQKLLDQLAQWRWQNIPPRYDTRINPSFDATAPGAHPLPAGRTPFSRGAPGCPPSPNP